MKPRGIVPISGQIILTITNFQDFQAIWMQTANIISPKIVINTGIAKSDGSLKIPDEEKSDKKLRNC